MSIEVVVQLTMSHSTVFSNTIEDGMYKVHLTRFCPQIGQSLLSRSFAHVADNSGVTATIASILSPVIALVKRGLDRIWQ